MSGADAIGYELDAMGIVSAADKSSVRGDITASWDYLRHYAEEFREFRHEAINVIEIGVAHGASLAMWPRFFTRAKIVGIDIEPDCARFSGGRVEVKIGSQDDPEFLRAVAADAPPSIVIDDGSHIASHIVTSFKTLFPLLEPGGVYVIEDMAFHYWAHGRLPRVPATEGKERQSAVLHRLLNELVVARLGHVTDLPGESDERNAVFAEVDVVSIVGGMAVIRKRKPRDLERTIKAVQLQIERLAREENVWLARVWFRLTATMAVHQGREWRRRVDRLKRLNLPTTQGASARQGARYAKGCFRLGELLLTHGRDPQALDSVLEGLAVAPNDLYGLRVCLRALRTLGRPDLVAADQAIVANIAARGETIDLPAIQRPPHMGYPHK